MTPEKADRRMAELIKARITRGLKSYEEREFTLLQTWRRNNLVKLPPVLPRAMTGNG